MKKSICSAMLLTVLCTSCASKPSKIETQYVSPLLYKDYDCDQIVIEMDRVSRRTTDIYFNLKNDATNDAVQMGVGLVLFWPALFLLEGGDGPEAAEYSRLKGEYEALHQCAVVSKCNIALLPPSPDELIKEEEEKRKIEMAKNEE